MFSADLRSLSGLVSDMASESNLPTIIALLDDLSSRRRLYDARKIVTDLFTKFTHQTARIACLLRQVSVAKTAGDTA